MKKNKNDNRDNRDNRDKKEFLQEFLGVCKPGKLEKNELAEVISEYQKDIINYCIKRGHLYNINTNVADAFNDLYNKMSKDNFIKALKYIRKNDDTGLDHGFVIVIAGFIEKNHKNEEVSSELIEEYSKLINKILGSRIKEICKKTGIDEDIATELLVIAPSREYISNDKYVGVYSQKMLKKLYIISNTKDIGLDNVKQIKKLFKAIFGKDLLDLIAMNILLEKKESLRHLTDKQQAVWNMMTAFALSIIEKQDKGHIIELIEYYCDRRSSDAKAQRDGARRIQLSASIDAETYPKTAKVVGKMFKNDKYSKYL